MKVSRNAARSPSTRDLPPAVAVFARAPIPSRAKTRLIPLLGAQGAANLQGALIADAVRKLCTIRKVAPYVFLAGRSPANFPVLKNSAITLRRQGGTNLGVRLERAFRFLLRHHAVVVIFGTDSPLLRLRILRLAIAKLRDSDAVLGPCPDGGYYLIGLRRDVLLSSRSKFRAYRSPEFRPKPNARVDRRERSVLLTLPAVFRSVRWSTRFTFRDTLRNLMRLGLSCCLLERLADVDRPQDLRVLRKAMATNAAARRTASNTWRFLASLSTVFHKFDDEPRHTERGVALPHPALRATLSPKERA
jgi:rSAM/selenodomain-associated transferase 1